VKETAAMTLDAVLRQLLKEVVREELAARDDRRPAAAPPAPVEFLSIKQAATALSVSPKTIRSWIDAGKLKAANVGRLRRIPRREIERFTANSNTEDATADELATRILRRGLR
jgi:excisionase family DNA binding protein